MKPIPYLLLFLILIINTSYAQSGQINTAPQPEVSKSITPHYDEPFIEGNSSENRRNRSLQLTLGPGIEFDIPIFSYTVGYFLKPNAVITARYSERHGYSGDSGHKGLTAVKVGYKKFAGNSFFYQPSAYFRKASHITTVQYKYEDLGLGFRIGNEWQWENFTLGIDWLGVNRHIVKLDESVNPPGLVPSSIDIDKNFTFDFVGLYVGYTF